MMKDIKLNSTYNVVISALVLSFLPFFATKISTPDCTQSIGVAQSNSQIKHSTELMSNNKYLTLSGI
jgi:hypothetical protein